jgi:hypothetical protein
MDSMAHRNQRLGLLLVKRKVRNAGKFKVRTSGLHFLADSPDRRCGSVAYSTQ